MKRRDFIKYTSNASGLLFVNSAFPSWMYNPEFTHLTILHTNDMHSRIDPFPNDGGRNSGLGGVTKRAALIKKIRAEEENILLLDAGDIFQGTPYFNFFGGEVEIKLMEEMGYDVATIGNHDFDGGIDNLVKQMKHGSFDIVNSNYNVEDNALSALIKKYVIKEKAGLKIGIFGLGIELESLVPESLYETTIYLDPIKQANKTAAHLKKEENCDLVICLSHLGYKYKGGKISDVSLAKQTRNIDIILGGHTHTFLQKPDLISDLDDQQVVINQAGWAGIMLGRLDLVFEKNKPGACTTCKNLLIGE